MNYEQALEAIKNNFPSVVENHSVGVAAEMIANTTYYNKVVVWEKDGEVFACRLSKDTTMSVKAEMWSGGMITSSRFSVGMWYPEKDLVIMSHEHVVIDL